MGRFGKWGKKIKRAKLRCDPESRRSVAAAKSQAVDIEI